MSTTRPDRAWAIEIVCALCGVHSIGGSVEAACRAYARHMVAAHGLTVSCADARAVATPVDAAVPGPEDPRTG